MLKIFFVLISFPDFIAIKSAFLSDAKGDDDDASKAISKAQSRLFMSIFPTKVLCDFVQCTFKAFSYNCWSIHLHLGLGTYRISNLVDPFISFKSFKMRSNSKCY